MIIIINDADDFSTIFSSPNETIFPVGPRDLLDRFCFPIRCFRVVVILIIAHVYTAPATCTGRM